MAALQDHALLSLLLAFFLQAGERLITGVSIDHYACTHYILCATHSSRNAGWKVATVSIIL